MFVEGDPTTHVFRVETGAVALYKTLADGRRQIVGFAYPGDLIGGGPRVPSGRRTAVGCAPYEARYGTRAPGKLSVEG